MTYYESFEGNNSVCTDDSDGDLIGFTNNFDLNTINISLGHRYYFGSTKKKGNDG